MIGKVVFSLSVFLSVVLSVAVLGCNGTVRKQPPAKLSGDLERDGSGDELSPEAKAIMERIRKQQERLAAAEGANVVTVSAGGDGTYDSGAMPRTSVERTVVSTQADDDGSSNPTRVPAETAEPSVEQLIVYLESRAPLNERQTRQLALLKAVRAGGDSESVLKAVADGSADSTFKELIALTSAYRAGDPDNTMKKLRSVEEDLRRRSSVSIHSPVFCTTVTGFGNYEAVKNPVFIRGRPALIYFEIRDFVCREVKAGRFEYHLACQLTILDGAGRVAGKVFNSDRAFFSKSHLRDCHWPITFAIPGDIYAGDYVLKLTVTDRLKNQVAEERFKLTVK